MPLDKLRKILSLMNLQEVARGSGVHPNTLYRLVGGSGANYETVQKILDYLKTQGVRLDG
jgi:predicted transcriptional regulator